MFDINPTGLLAVLFLGAFVQSVTGFGLGLVVIASVMVFSIAPIEFTAIVIGFSAFVNLTLQLMKLHQQIPWAQIRPLLLLQVPAIGLGIYLLSILTSNNVYLLELVFGLFFSVAALVLFVKPPQLTTPSPTPAFAGAGFFSGTMTGMFAAGGPPLVYLFYRQPWTASQIRAGLTTIFVMGVICRMTIVVSAGQVTQTIVWWGLASIPAVFLGTWVGQKVAPMIPDDVQKRLAFGLLACLGLALLSGAISGLTRI